MEKITFKKLHDLVASVTVLFEKSYPIRFSITNGNNTLHYEVGIGEWYESMDEEWNDMVHDLFPYPIKVQYLSLCCGDNPNEVFSFLDTQDSEVMVYEEIEKMLKKKCNITDKSKIYLDEDNSFNGFERTIYEEETSQMLRNELTKAYEMKNNANDKIVKENIPIVYKCETSGETYIISAKDIISIKPFLIQNNEGEETYVKVEFYNNELCVTDSIYCTKIEQI